MTGIITLSLEIELGWGMHDKPRYSHLSQDRKREEQALSRLLSCCEENDIQMSFNVVGHLLHSSCEGYHEGSYPSGWWKEDPGTNENENPLFYSSEMIDSILESSVEHEICTHLLPHPRRQM